MPSVQEGQHASSASVEDSLIPKPAPSDLSRPARRRQSLRPWAGLAMITALTSVLLGVGIAFILSKSSGQQRGCSLPADLSSPASSGVWGQAQLLPAPLQPTVILVSMDGFRVDYHLKIPGGNISKFRQESTFAADGMLPPFPSVTFPSHYSMVTGLHPAWHGIMANVFVDPTNRSALFSYQTTDPKWWLGEPLWETAANQGIRAATAFWVGSNVKKGAWGCPPDRCFAEYNASITFMERVDAVLRWMALPPATRPSFVTLYLDEPDESGHKFGGPDTPEVGRALERVDAAVGHLMGGLQKLGLKDSVNVILVSDHGMLAVCTGRTVALSEFEAHVPGFNRQWVALNAAGMVGVLPPKGADVRAVFGKMVAALPRIRNGDRMALYLKPNLPPRFLLSSAPRLPPIVGLLQEGFLPTYNPGDSVAEAEAEECFGTHGYDNRLASMRAIFYGRGPRFARGRAVPSFSNVEVYGVVASVLGLTPAPNNGSSDFPDFLLLPK